MHYIGYVGNLVERYQHTAEYLLYFTLQLLGKCFFIFLMVAPLVGFFLQFIEQGAERVSMVAKCIDAIMASYVSTEPSSLKLISASLQHFCASVRNVAKAVSLLSSDFSVSVDSVSRSVAWFV